MKVARILALAAAMTLAVTSMSFAAGAVWFEAMPTLPNSTAGTSGPGMGLDLGCDITGGLRCEWLVTILYENFDGGAFGSSLDLGTLDPADDGKFNIKTYNNGQNDLQVFPNPTATNVGGGLLIENAGGSNLSPGGAPAGLYVIAQFVLSKNKLPGELNTSLIYAGIGASEFGGDDPAGFDFYEVISIGPNPPVIGYNLGPWPYGAQPLPVITVRNVPEPATLGLIGLGVLALVRRRK